MAKNDTVKKYQLPPLGGAAVGSVGGGSGGGVGGGGADTVDGLHASSTAEAWKLCSLNGLAKGPFSITGDADTVDGYHGHTSVSLDATADVLLALSGQALSLDTQVANVVLAGPASGAAAAPTFRALVSGDLPTHDMLAKHNYTGGAALDVFGLSAANTPALLSPSNDPGAAAAILKTDANGNFRVRGIAISSGTPTAGALRIRSVTNPQARVAYDGSNYADLYTSSVGTLTVSTAGTTGDVTLQPAGKLNLSPTGNQVVVDDDTAVQWSDVALSRGAANRLDLASGDSLMLSDTGQLQWSDITVARGAANRLDLGSGDALGVPGGATLGLAETPGAGEQLRLAYNATNRATFAVGSAGTLTVGTVTGGGGGNLVLQPAGDIIVDPTGNDVLPLTGYDVNIGSLSYKFLQLHCAELWVETLVAQNTIATIGGRILVGPTTALTADLAAGATQMIVKHNEMAYGDIAYLEAGGNVEFVQVGGYAVVAFLDLTEKVRIAGDHTSEFGTGVKFTIVGAAANNGEWEVRSSTYVAPNTEILVTGNIAPAAASGYILYTGAQGTGPFLYVSVTRDYESSGTSHDWVAGDAVFNTGTTGDGFIDLYSTGGVNGVGAGPTIAGNVRYTTAYNGWTTSWAIGNLNGLYGYGVTAYGAAFGKYATNSAFVTVDATNGFRVLHRYTSPIAGQGAGVEAEVDEVLAQWDAAGTIIVGKTGAGQSNVYITGGAVSVRANATERIGLSAAGVLTVKDSAGAAVFTFDGSAGAEFTKPLTLATTGGIYQGSGTFASPTTGLKLWNDSGTGRIAGYNGGNLQWYGGTDGKLYAGAGAVWLDSGGINRNVTSGATAYDRWWDGTKSPAAFLVSTGGVSPSKAVALTIDAYDNIASDEYASSYASIGVNGEIWFSAENNWGGTPYTGLFMALGLTATSVLTVQHNGVDVLVAGGTADGVAIGKGLYVGDATGTPVDNTITCDGSVYVGDTANANATLGLTVNQGANENEVLALKSSDVAHGMTTVTETDTFAFIKKVAAASGGLVLEGLTEVTVGLMGVGCGATDDTTKSTSGAGYVELRAYKKNGTGTQAAGADANLLVVRNTTTTRFIFDAEGSAHSDVEWTTFDEHDDVAVLDALEATLLVWGDPLRRGFGQLVVEQAPLLERLGVVHLDHDNPGHAMVNWTRLSMLLTGAVRQLAAKVARLEAAQA